MDNVFGRHKISKVTVYCLVIEMFAVSILVLGRPGWPLYDTVLFNIALWYNIIPMSVASFIWLALFGHGSPETGPIWMWYTAEFMFIYCVQVGISIFLVNRIMRRKPYSTTENM